MTDGLVKVLIFDKTAASKKKDKIYTLVWLKNRHYYQTSYFWDHVLTDIFEKVV